jgi:hypothetical protein
MLDIGTTNETLLADPLYLGLRQHPPSEKELDEFVDEFVQAVQEVFPGCCIHFEDWKGTDAVRLLAKYKDKTLCYNDDIQGTAGVTLAGLINALKITTDRRCYRGLQTDGPHRRQHGGQTILAGNRRGDVAHQRAANYLCPFQPRREA